MRRITSKEDLAIASRRPYRGQETWRFLGPFTHKAVIILLISDTRKVNVWPILGDSNSGLLGVKRESFLCAKPPPHPRNFYGIGSWFEKSVLKRVLLEVVEENLRLGKKLATYRFIFVKARDGGGLAEAWRWRPDLLRLQFAFQRRILEPIMFEKNLKLSIVARKCSGNSFAWFLKIFKDCHGKPGIFRFKLILS